MENPVPYFLPIVGRVIYLQAHAGQFEGREDFVSIVLYKQHRTVFISSDWTCFVGTFFGHLFLLIAVHHA